MMSLIGWIMSNGADMLAALSALVGALIAISLLVPGKEPEKSLQKILDLLKKVSKK